MEQKITREMRGAIGVANAEPGTKSMEAVLDRAEQIMAENELHPLARKIWGALGGVFEKEQFNQACKKTWVEMIPSTSAIENWFYQDKGPGVSRAYRTETVLDTIVCVINKIRNCESF